MTDMCRKKGEIEKATRHSSLLEGFCGLFLCILMMACSSIDCPVENTVALNCEVLNPIEDSLFVWTQRSDGRDTLLNRGISITSFALPVSNQHPEDMLVFCRLDTAKAVTLDTLWVAKNDIPHFESVDCKALFFHELTGVRSTHHGIDTVSINNKSVTYDSSVTHLYIKFKE